MISIRLFGAADCDKCVAVTVALHDVGQPYEFIDASRFDDEQINALCDRNSVSDLPHIQFLDDQGKVMRELAGDFLPDDVLALIESFKAEHG